MESPTQILTDTELLVSRLGRALRDPLPGPEAQYKMAPPYRPQPPAPSDRALSDARQSAVLALIHSTPTGPSLVFTLRPLTLTHHAGQISFPGGGFEPGDSDLVATALREAEEELGIATHRVVILGAMSPLYIEPSRNLVHPYVGWLAELPPLQPDPVEVAGVLSVPLTRLLDPTTLGVHHWQHNGQRLAAPCFRIDQDDIEKHPSQKTLWRDACIWGATAMMLNELLQIIRKLS